MEWLFTNGKSHLLRNVIHKIIYHQRCNNDLSRLQLSLWEEYNKEQHTFDITLI